MDEQRNAVLVARNVTKFFGMREAVKNVSLQIYEGEIFGFIGPNGAGKTTFIRMIAGLADISSGNIVVNGYDIAKKHEKAIERVGGIIEEPRMYNHLSGMDNLKYFAKLHGIDRKKAKERIDYLATVCKMQNRIKDKVRTYSLGMRQRLGIICSLLHRPNLLLLDEPMNGLDPTGVIEIRHFLQQIAKQEKVAILISSHNLAELEQLCTSYAIIKDGTVVQEGNIGALKSQISSSKRFVVSLSHPNHAARIVSQQFNKIIKAQGNTIIIEDCTEQLKQQILAFLVQQHISIFGIENQTKSLEEIYIEQTDSAGSGEAIK